MTVAALYAPCDAAKMENDVSAEKEASVGPLMRPGCSASRVAVRAVLTAGVAVGLVGCGEGPIFVWTVRDIVGLSILGLIATGFLLFFLWICLLAAVDAVKAKWRKWTTPTAPSKESPNHKRPLAEPLPTRLSAPTPTPTETNSNE